MSRPRRVALVTGGTRGIGFAVARALAVDGLDLALCGRRPADAVTPAVAELTGLGSEVLYIPADVGSQNDRSRLLDAVRARFGAIDILVNNAGMAPRVRSDILDATEESFEEVLGTNLRGPYFLTRDVAREMIAAPRSEAPRVVVFVTSVSAALASTNRGEYCVSKAGLSMAARLFALRLAEHGIAVFEVRPGIVSTDMTASVRDRYDEAIGDGLVPERRWGRPEDVGRVVAALSRGELPHATGSVINVDGGLSIPRL